MDEDESPDAARKRKNKSQAEVERDGRKRRALQRAASAPIDADSVLLNLLSTSMRAPADRL